MSAKLDQSLDEIVSSRRVATRGRGRPRGRRGTTRNAPVGGVQKNTRAATAKAAGGKTPATTASVTGRDTKIIVSNLPPDVTESQIKTYFGNTVGRIQKVSLQYDSNAISRGIATVIFSKAGVANEAVAKLNGLLVDKRPMKVELIVDASRASEPVKSLTDRVTKTAKAQPKAAGVAKTTDATTARGAGRPVRGARGRVARGRNAGRGKPKTADELDAEMTDYFTVPATNGDGATLANGNGNAATGNEDAGMDGIA